MRGATVAAAVLTGLSLIAAGCDRASSTSTDDAAGGAASNERRLTRAQSLELVRWMDTFRGCMLSHGADVGTLAKTETHLALPVPAPQTAAEVVAMSETCGEAQGGPPQKSSLIYRQGRILLFLPKQCLLDETVAST